MVKSPREKSGERSKRPRLEYATPVSSTATVAPRPPRAPASSTFCHASGALTPLSARKFHCRSRQPPGAPEAPGSRGLIAAIEAIGLGAAVATSGRARSSATVSAMVSPSVICSTRVRGANASGSPTPVSRWTSARSARSASCS
jgi:hypothetical protein